MIAEDWIKQCAKSDHYRYSRHADRERQNDGLALAEVEQALVSGRIIEEYPDRAAAKAAFWPALLMLANRYTRYAPQWRTGWSS